MGIFITIVLVLLIITAIVLISVAYYLFRKAICRKKEEDSDIADMSGTNWANYLDLIGERVEWLGNQESEDLWLTSFDGFKLHGTFFPAKTKTTKTLLALHGYQSSGISGYAALSPFYLGMGYNLLIVDDRSHGQSEGKYIGFGCLDRYDCMSWIQFLTKRFDNDCEIFLHGVSMGAATVLMAASMGLPACVRGMICDCGFTSAWDVFHHLLQKNYHLPPFPLYPILPMASGMCRYLAGYGFQDSSSDHSVKNTDIPLLLIHGDKDDFVPTFMGHKIFEACASEKQLMIVEGAGHAESYYVNPAAYESAVQEFIEKYRTM